MIVAAAVVFVMPLSHSSPALELHRRHPTVTQMSLLRSAVDALNFAAGFTNDYNGTGLFESVKLKRAPEDQRASIDPCPVPKALRKGGARPEWTKRTNGPTLSWLQTKQRTNGPTMVAAETGGEAERIVLPADYRLTQGLGGAAALTALAPFGLGLPLAVPLGALTAFLGTRTRVVHFAFDADALEILAEEAGGGLTSSGENFAVGGRNRWAYDAITEWAMYPNPDSPILVYFRETATAATGQGHLFPVLTAPDKLKELLDQRIGADKRVESLPKL